MKLSKNLSSAIMTICLLYTSAMYSRLSRGEFDSTYGAVLTKYQYTVSSSPAHQKIFSEINSQSEHNEKTILRIFDDVAHNFPLKGEPKYTIDILQSIENVLQAHTMLLNRIAEVTYALEGFAHKIIFEIRSEIRRLLFFKKDENRFQQAQLLIQQLQRAAPEKSQEQLESIAKDVRQSIDGQLKNFQKGALNTLNETEQLKNVLITLVPQSQELCTELDQKFEEARTAREKFENEKKAKSLQQQRPAARRP